MKSKFRTMIFLALIFSANFNSYPITYYVSATGNNSNNGLTPQTAFATLQHAANIVTAGDSVLVLSGNYVGFDIRTNGTQNFPIFLKTLRAALSLMNVIQLLLMELILKTQTGL
jgi:hypothetical protein